jgi:hypothetical protein
MAKIDKKSKSVVNATTNPTTTIEEQEKKKKKKNSIEKKDDNNDNTLNDSEVSMVVVGSVVVPDNSREQKLQSSLIKSFSAHPTLSSRVPKLPLRKLPVVVRRTLFETNQSVNEIFYNHSKNNIHVMSCHVMSCHVMSCHNRPLLVTRK